eukprot:COSAG05_NODE_15712_length_363_cov_0.943182_1_plen_43_part_10
MKPDQKNLLPWFTAAAEASMVLQRPGYGFSQAFCWCSFAGTLT